MTLSQESSLFSEILSNEIIPEGKMEYFRERHKNRIYDFVVGRFLEKEKNEGLTKAEIARRINKDPAQITRWLSTPSNWTLDTISDLMLVVCAGELNFSVSKFKDIKPRNYHQLDHLEYKIQASTSSPSMSVVFSGASKGIHTYAN